MLPRDLFYVGRFDLGQTPEYFRTMSLEDRQKVVKNELEQMYLKYKDYGYKIFELI
jgi:hypothetical protein